MTLIPMLRPAGSVHVLRYRGTIAIGLQNGDAYPKTNATIPADTIGAPDAFDVFVRFALFDPGAASPPLSAAAFALSTRRFPSHVYDDTMPAGASPHAAIVATGMGANPTDLDIGRETWAQNLMIHYNKIDTNVLVADTGLFTPGGAGAQVFLDTADSGLGLSTGLPVVMIRFSMFSEAQPPNDPYPFDVDLTFEIRHSVIR